MTHDGSVWRATAYDPSLGRKVRLRDPGTGLTAFATQREAVAAKEAFEAQKAAGPTVDEWVDQWLSTPRYHERRAASTMRLYRERTRKFAEDFAGVPLRSITLKDAKRWAAENPSRVRTVLTMLNDARNDGVIAGNPFRSMSGEVISPPRPAVVLSEEQVGLLISTAYRLFPGWPVLGAMVTTGACTGIRLGELCALGWEHVDDRNWETIQVCRMFDYGNLGKGDFVGVEPARDVVMPTLVADALRDLPRANAAGLVFYTRRDHGAYYPRLHGYYWGKLRTAFAKRTGDGTMQTLSFDALGDFYVCRMASRGVPMSDIATQVGNKNSGRLAERLGINQSEDAAARIRRLAG